MSKARLLNEIFQGLLMVAVAVFATPDLGWALSNDLAGAASNLTNTELPAEEAAPVISGPVLARWCRDDGAGALKKNMRKTRCKIHCVKASAVWRLGQYC